MLQQHPLAILLAEPLQPIARKPLENLEQRDIQQMAVALFGHVQHRDPSRKSNQIAKASTPFPEVGQEVKRGVHQVEIGQCAVEIVEGRSRCYRAYSARSCRMY